MALFSGDGPIVCREVYERIMLSKTIPTPRLLEAKNHLVKNNPLMTDILEYEVMRMIGIYPETAFTATLLMYFTMDEQMKELTYSLTEQGVPIISNDIHTRIIGYSENDELESRLMLKHDDFFNKSQHLAELMKKQIPYLPVTHPDSAYHAATLFYMLMEEQGKHDLAQIKIR